MRETMLIIHFVGLAMGLGTSLAFLFLGFASAKMEKGEAMKFRMNTFALSRMGHIGLALLIISGGYLMTPYWGALGSTPLLAAKLILVVVLTLLIAYISIVAARAKKSGDMSGMAKIAPIGRLNLLLVFAILVLAVFVFR